ncbi:hypothetical protein FKP32DRAFT_655757 [Trametes sanguinea]|nr:hypothetical protein FKP32DRAFT_655757 [Trametes sanguinea]
MTARDNAHLPSRPLNLSSPRETRGLRRLLASDKVRRRRTCRRTLTIATVRRGSHGNPTVARLPFTEAEQPYGSRSLCAGLASPAQRP